MPEGSQPLRLRPSKVHARKRASVYLAFIFPALYLTTFERNKQKEEKKLCAKILPYSASLYPPPSLFSAPRYFPTPTPTPSKATFPTRKVCTASPSLRTSAAASPAMAAPTLSPSSISKL